MWRKVLWSIGVSSLALVGGMSIVAARFEPTLPPSVWVGPVFVGGLTHDAAATKLRQWWDYERRRTVRFRGDGYVMEPPSRSLTSAGLRLDDKGSVAQIPEERFWEAAKRTLRLQEPERRQFGVKLTVDLPRIDAIVDEIERLNKKDARAQVSYDRGMIVLIYEPTAASAKADALATSLISAGTSGDGVVDLEIVHAPKRVPDEALDEIKEVVASYTTRFSASQRARSSNIELAASKIDRLVLLPGETFSFNGAVGRRTIAAGFLEAGVYANGRHDTGIGGGICQVSTTLYNAVLLADLKILERQNHSLPVPYVPPGRDATVDYGNIDFRFQNSGPTTIGITAEYGSGKLTFRILGRKTAGKEVRIGSGAVRSWSRGEKVVHDGTLAPGKWRVIEKGAVGRRVTTYRVVLQDGREVRRDSMGTSSYSGAVRIVARNLKPPPASPAATAPPSAP